LHIRYDAPMPHNPLHHPQAAHRIARRRILACEGRATETGYFEAMRKHLRLPADTLVVLGTKGTTPLTLVCAVIQERDRRQFDAADECWVVCDGDEHRLADPAAWKQAHELAAREGVRLAVSNPSFELWYLLHFQDQHAALDAKDALAKLKKHLPGYTKATVLFPELLPRTADAIKRAKGLKDNPSTGVGQLVGELLGLV
jgi:hypothetical protein